MRALGMIGEVLEEMERAADGALFGLEIGHGRAAGFMPIRPTADAGGVEVVLGIAIDIRNDAESFRGAGVLVKRDAPDAELGGDAGGGFQ
jgi:hypothetical protein